MKQFAVIGLGRFGSSVARTLQAAGHQVLGIDKSEERVRHNLDNCTRAVEADATDEQALRALGIRNFDTVIVGVGGDIQASILVTLMLKELGVKHVLAKAQSELHGRVLYKIGADRVVFPERDMGSRVAKNLVATNILEYIELAPDISILEFMVGSAMVGHSLRQLDFRNKFQANIIAVKRGDEFSLALKADEKIEEGDVLVVVGKNDDLRRLERV
ncbi:MAG: Ktr system potassium uptake protein A [Firmicutes bacterium]|nr:Ktr system potassium uptake protein A [candidate division NPL-UPA2 bacterium]MBT9153867.1 Ktr system potassium uptake protein A [candidate division NPL-UPA2 bacterium]